MKEMQGGLKKSFEITSRGSIRGFGIWDTYIYMAINLKLQHTPPHHPPPRAFDCRPCLGSREFDTKGLPGGGELKPCLGGVGNLNQKSQVFPAEYTWLFPATMRDV